MSSVNYAIKIKFNLNARVLMEVAEGSELYYRLNLQNLTIKVRGVFRALSNIWDGAFCRNK